MQSSWSTIPGDPMDRVAGDLYNGALFAALWMTGLGLGLSSSAAEFLAPLRNFRLVASLIVLDAVAIPLLVWGLTHLFNVPRDAAIGLLLVGVASAGPLGITASRIAGGDARAALSFVVVLEAANAAAIPVWVALLLPAGVVLSLGQLIVTVVALVLAPLAIGIAIRMWRGPGVQRWSTPLATVSNLLVLFIIVLVLIRYSGDIADSAGNGVVAVAVITVVAALGAGWTIGAPYPGLRVVVALVTAIRANGLALAIAQASFPSRPATQAAVVTFGVFSIVVPTAAALGIAGWRVGLLHGSAKQRR